MTLSVAAACSAYKGFPVCQKVSLSVMHGPGHAGGLRRNSHHGPQPLLEEQDLSRAVTTASASLKHQLESCRTSWQRGVKASSSTNFRFGYLKIPKVDFGPHCHGHEMFACRG